MDYDPAFLARMGQLSAELQPLGAAAGLSRGETIRLVARVARKHRLRHWADVENDADYLAVIEATRAMLTTSR